jgi:PAS domain S-box-containing protein
MENSMELQSGKILIVGDASEHLTILTQMLEKRGHQVRPAINGPVALKTAQNVMPDVILLDIMMPGMDGYEVCRQLKFDEQTRNIPVVFINTLDHRFDPVKAFRAGGVDYITKPFQAEEVLVRIETHVTLRQTQKQLQEQRRQLEQEHRERKRAEQIQTSLYLISEAVQTTQALDTLLPAIRDILGAFVPVENFYIALYDTDTNTISFPYYVEDSVAVKRRSRQFGNGLAEYVIRTGKPLLLTPEYRKTLIARGEMQPIQFTPTVVDWLGVPLKSDDRVIGILTIRSHSPEVRLGEEEKQVLIFVSSQIALAIERKRSEELLDKLQKAFDTTDVGVTITDTTGTIVYINPADAHMHGYTVEELIGRPSNVFSVPELRHQHSAPGQYREIFTNWRRERVNMHKNGSIFPVKLISNPIYDKHGTLLGQVTICEDITDRKASEKLLQDSEERYRGVFENATTGIFQAALDGRFIAVNPEMARMMGYHSAKECLTRITDIAEQLFVEPRHWHDMTEMIQLTKEAASVETRCRHKDGGEVLILLNIWVVCDDQGELLYLEGLMEDITERKQMEETLFRQAILLNSVAAAMNTLLVTSDFHNAISDTLELLGFATEVDRVYIFENHKDPKTGDMLMSQRFEWAKESQEIHIDAPDFQRLPYSPAYARWYETLQAQTVLSGLVRDFPECERPLLERQNTQSIIMVPIMIRDYFWGFIGFEDCYSERQWRQEEESILFAMAGSIGGAVARQQAEAALIAANQDLQNTLEHLQHTQTQLVRSEKMAALGQLIAGIAHEINTPLGAIRSSIGDISTIVHETLEQLPEFLHTLPPDLLEIFFILLKRARQRDVTLSSRQERQFKRMLTDSLKKHRFENTRKLSEMLVNIGIYDDLQPFLPLLRTPDHYQMLDMVYKLSGLHESTDTIMTAVDRASKIVFALKTYAHKEQSGTMNEANLTEGIDTVLTLYHNQLKHGVEVIRKYAQLPPLLCYPDELNQVWTNLIHNALQAMENQGTLTIDVIRQAEAVIVSITDTGKGIPEHIQPRIFEPFFTTKPAGEGTGLGLDIVQKIIDKHQGMIQFESQPGKTTFEVRLPMRHT